MADEIKYRDIIRKNNIMGIPHILLFFYNDQINPKIRKKNKCNFTN